jgi:hypothetical protein
MSSFDKIRTMPTSRSREYINTSGNSKVEKAALQRVAGNNKFGRFRPDRERIAILYSAVTDPLQRQAVALKTGMFYGEVKSIDEVAKIMKIPREQAETLLKQAAQLINPSLKLG